jgi:hypothetical protein
MKFQTLSFRIGITAVRQVKGMEKTGEVHTLLVWKAKGKKPPIPVAVRCKT